MAWLQVGRRRGVLAAAGVIVAALAVGAVVLLGSRSSAHGSDASGVPPGETTTEISRRTLSESATVDGTLGYGSTLELYDRLSGTFTWLPKVGAVVRRGGALFRVNEQPVVLMYGSVPAYRTLKEGVADGPDVAELNANLIALGFDPYGAIPADDEQRYGAATATAVKRWQESRGLKETGAVELGRVLFAPGARRVTKLHVSLGQDPPGSSEAEGEPAAAKETPAKTPAKEKAKGKAKEKAKGKAKEKAKGKAKEKAEGKAAEEASKEQPAKEPSSSEKPASEEGGAAGAGQLVLSTTSTQQIVTLALKAEQQQLARVGERVPVILPGGSVVHGRVAEVGTVASEASEDEGAGGGGGGGSGGGGGNGESATIAVTIDLDRRVAHLDQAPVSVELIKSVSRHALVVPATALMAAAGGGYAIEVLEAGRRRQLPVSPGMFANGYVQVEGPGLQVGMEVLEPR